MNGTNLPSALPVLKYVSALSEKTSPNDIIWSFSVHMLPGRSSVRARQHELQLLQREQPDDIIRTAKNPLGDVIRSFSARSRDVSKLQRMEDENW